MSAIKRLIKGKEIEVEELKERANQAQIQKVCYSYYCFNNEVILNAIDFSSHVADWFHSALQNY